VTTHPIYLDYHASTPVDPRVLARMLPHFCENFGNAASRSHAYGWAADAAVSDARLQILELIGAHSPDEIVFTSGATESNNLALRGVVEGFGGGHVITSAIEHPCVLATCRDLERRGSGCTVVGVDGEGRVSPAAIQSAMRPDTVLISIMGVNNEVGTIQPIGEIARIARRAGILFHSDCAQAAGRVPINVAREGIDLLSISAHKIYGPKGVGALFVSKRRRPIPLVPQMLGGKHERGLRSGTLNVPGIVGFGEAARLVRLEARRERGRLGALRDGLLERLRSGLPEIRVHGSMTDRVAGNLNFSVPHLRADSFLNALPGVALSGGAACASGTASGSHVLQAMGVGNDLSNGAIRVGLGRMTTEREVEMAGRQMVAAAQKLLRARRAGPADPAGSSPLRTRAVEAPHVSVSV
jgi:cysteine desulfurase